MKITDKQFSEAIENLKHLVSIPSISNKKNREYNVHHLFDAANWIKSQLQILDFKVEQHTVNGSAPFIIAEQINDVAFPTILLYSHYDIQPVDRSKWDTDPFTVIEKNGRLYGRGASDDKAGIIAILAALNTYHDAPTKLNVNIKVLFEGEEEYGSENLNPLLKRQAKKLHADVLVILDCCNRDTSTGTITSSTRGCANLLVKIKAYNKPLHSGLGCIAPDPIIELANLIASLKNPRDIPGYTTNAEPIGIDERELLKQSSQTAESYAEKIQLLSGEHTLRGPRTSSVYERIVEEPSISINNFNSGKPNGGNSIQDEASCEINMRILPGQNPEHILDAVKTYLLTRPRVFGLPVEITQPEGGHWGWKADFTRPFVKKYFEAMEENFPHIGAMPTGGTLPLLNEFQAVFPRIEMICVGIEDPESAAHSHNESQHIGVLRSTIDSLIAFFKKAQSVKLEPEAN